MRKIIAYLCILFALFAVSRQTFVNIPGCPSLYQFDFQNSDDNDVPRCYCDNSTETSEELIQINCIYYSTLKDLGEAMRRVVKAKKHLSSIFIERMVFTDDGLPDDYFQQHKVSPTEISIVKCEGNGGRLMIRDSTFRGLETNITKLSIKECRLTKFPDNIRRLTSLHTLELQKTAIVSLGTNDLNGLSNLEYLDLSGNGMQIIEPNSFKTLQNLRILKLGPGNRLNSSVFDEINKNLPKLIDLDLSSNNVTQMSKRVLALTQNLQTLNLANNNIYNIKNETFVGLNRLRRLDLRVNLIHELELDSFLGLNNLNQLYLAGNYLPSINGELLKLPNLTTLDVGYNNFATIIADTFKKLPRLTELDLRKNDELTEINDDSLSGLSQLQYANFSNTNISRLTSNLLKYTPNLRTLDVGNTKIRTLAKDVFGRTKNLSWISLAATKITTLPEGIFEGLTQLSDLDLSGNNWVCDTKLLWLSRWIVEKIKSNSIINFHSLSDVTCFQPDDVSNKPLVRLFDSNFPLETTVATITTVVATTATNVTTINETSTTTPVSNVTTAATTNATAISYNETTEGHNKAPTPAAVENLGQSTKDSSLGWSAEDKNKITIIIAVVVVVAACATIAIVVAIVITMKKKRRKASRLAALKNFVPTSTMGIEMCQRPDNSRLSDIEIIRGGDGQLNNYKIHQPGGLYAEIMLQHQKDAHQNFNNNNNVIMLTNDDLVSSTNDDGTPDARSYRDSCESPLPPPPPPPPPHHHHHL